jgi:type I restriction enzyme S subunit
MNPNTSLKDPSSWQVEPLGRHAEIKARIGWRGLSSGEYTTDGPYLIAGQHITDGRVRWESCDHISDYRYEESKEIALRDGDIIITKDGTIGRVARIEQLPGKATLNGTMMLVRPKRTLDFRYL